MHQRRRVTRRSIELGLLPAERSAPTAPQASDGAPVLRELLQVELLEVASAVVEGV